MKKEEKELRRRMLAYLEKKYQGVIPPTWSAQQMLETAYNFNEAEKQFRQLNQFSPLSHKMKILDAGCGFGYFTAYALKKSYDTWGYEVDKELAMIGRRLLKINSQNPSRIKFVQGQKLPYKDKVFDFINLHFVLDYVSDVPALISELVRILKDDGQIFIIVPNYRCCYSPVYMAIFLPWLPLAINKSYFRFIKRPNTQFLESLTFTTPTYCEKIFKSCGLEFKNFGLVAWQRLVSEEDLEDRSLFLKSIVAKSEGWRLSWLLRFLGRMGFYTPLIYLLKKRPR